MANHKRIITMLLWSKKNDNEFVVSGFLTTYLLRMLFI